MFSRVLVANRGEIAVRVIRSLHELGIEAVAVYSTADEDALHVRIADQAVRVGPAPAAESYLRSRRSSPPRRRPAATPCIPATASSPRIRRSSRHASRTTSSSSARRAGRCGDGRQDRGAARDARRADVPIVPGTDGAIDDVEARAARRARSATRCCSRRPPAAAARGCGSWRRRTRSTTRSARRPARRGRRSATATLYVEKVLVAARARRDPGPVRRHGNVLTLGERECSIQRRHQKLIEETPSPALTPELREEMEAAAERACRAVGYVNAGTLEFLLGPGRRVLVHRAERAPPGRASGDRDVHRASTSSAAQLHVAAGEPLELTGRAPRRGHAIEIRLNAEDPARDFMPAPGVVARFRPALGPGVRIDTFVEDGTAVPPFYDSLLAKLVVWDADRAAAIARAERALEETVIEGVPTTREFALGSIRSDEFRSGAYSTSTLAELAAVADPDLEARRPITVPDSGAGPDRPRGGERRRRGSPPAHDRLDARAVRLSAAARRGRAADVRSPSGSRRRSPARERCARST